MIATVMQLPKSSRSRALVFSSAPITLGRGWLSDMDAAIVNAGPSFVGRSSPATRNLSL